jgi:glycosyltransferase involved in cell wall biosynthesis
MLPPAVGEPLAKAARAQARVPALLGQAAKGLLAARRRSAEPVVAGPLLSERAQPGDALCFFGIPGGDPRLFAMTEAVVDAVGLKLTVLIHDIIRLRRPEFFQPDPNFERLVRWALPRADQLLAVSKATAADVARWARLQGLALKRPPRAITPGAGYAAAPTRSLPPGLEPGRYALYVSTIEPRKNHAQALHIWRRLLDALPRAEVPKLVFAGRVGWMADDLMSALESTQWLDGMAMFVREPGDGALAALYKGAAFTLFLSHDEGWGLPVSESLAFGRTCVASCAPSVMEAGGDFCFYVDPDDTSGAYAMVRGLIEQPHRVAQMEDHIRAHYTPRSWEDCARAIQQAIEALSAPDAPSLAPAPGVFAPP